MSETKKEKTAEEIFKQLSAPFTRKVGDKIYPAVKWLPNRSAGDRLVCIPYISGQQVKDRLNEVLGLGGWMFESRLESDKTRTGSLQILINGQWIQRDGTGTQSQTEKEKGAETDALKRAARNFGVGSFLDTLPPYLIKTKMNNNNKPQPIDNGGRFLYGDNLHNFINGYSTNQGYLMQIVMGDEEVWNMPEFKTIFNRYNIK